MYYENIFPIKSSNETNSSENNNCQNNKKRKPKISLRNNRNIRKRIFFFYYTITLGVALCALLYLGSEFVTKSLQKDNLHAFFTEKILGEDSNSSASSFLEIMLKQSFWGKDNNSSDIASKNSPNGKNSDTQNSFSEDKSSTDTSEDKIVNIYDFDYSAVPAGENPIVPTDLSAKYLGDYYLSNETPYSPDIEALVEKFNTVSVWNSVDEKTNVTYNANEPLVLIIHTHGTEAFTEEGKISYNKDTVSPRSDDISKNVVAVGEVMKDVLVENGIPTVHCTIMHDLESYKDSYNRAAEAIRQYLKEYPSIKYVFDVHRDSLIKENGEKIKPVVLLDGELTAQVMSVVGTDYRGADHPTWENNLSLAAVLQDRLNASYGNLARHINLRGASFNEQYTSGSLLLEIGSCGNTLEEAKRAGKIVSYELSQIIKDECQQSQ